MISTYAKDSLQKEWLKFARFRKENKFQIAKLLQ